MTIKIIWKKYIHIIKANYITPINLNQTYLYLFYILVKITFEIYNL